MDEKNNMPDERVKKVEDFLLDPEKVVFESLEDFKGAVQVLIDALSGVDLAALAQLRGEDGITPKRGVDYMTESDISALEAFILDNIPVIGVDLPSREQVEAFIKAQVAKIPRVKGDPGKDGKRGNPGKDGSPDSPNDIINKIRTLRGKKNQMLRTEDIAGLDNKLRIYDEAVNEVASMRESLERIFIPTGAPGGGEDISAVWGGITGTLSDQTDLQNALNAKQATLVSGTNIKTINSTSLLGSGDIAVQPTLVSGTNIKTINSTSLLGSGDIAVQAVLVSGTNIKTINGTSLLGSGDIVIGGSAAWGAITGTLSSQTDLQTALDAKVNLSQAVGQTIGATGARLTKLWAVDITVTNAITGSVTGNAGTATALQNARTIGGISFDGTANITVATATGGFTISGGNLALGTNSITMSGSIGVTGTRVTKIWATDGEFTNMPTVGGTSLSSLFAALAGSTSQAFAASTIDLGNADTTLSRGAAGFLAVEGNRVPSPASQAAGDTLYRGSTEWERLPKGTAGQVLTMNAGATAPEWAAASGGTAVSNWINHPLYQYTGGYTEPSIADNTVAFFGLCNIPTKVTFTKLAFKPAGTATPLTLKIAFYTEDGQTKIREESVSIGTESNAIVTHTLSASLTLNPGNYYIVITPTTSEAGRTMQCWAAFTSNSLQALAQSVPSSAIMSGIKTITAATLPSSFNPTSDITATEGRLIALRFYN